ncbi:MAG: hypothetical protein ACI8S6_000313 [Myxococcota bacterium]|jgi:hypothetical protein
MPSPRAILLAGLLLPGTAAAQSMSSAGALGDNLLTVVPLSLMGILGLPSVVAYFLIGRWRLGRWPRWLGALLPLLASPVLGLMGVFMALDGARALVTVGMPIFGELALILVMTAIAKRLQKRAQA